MKTFTFKPNEYSSWKFKSEDGSIYIIPNMEFEDAFFKAAEKIGKIVEVKKIGVHSFR